MKKMLPFLIVLSVLTAGCGVNLPGQGDQEDLVISGFAEPLSGEEYSRLDSEQQYQVADKLLGSMYKGVAVADFFDISQGMDELSLKEGHDFLSSVRTALSRPLDSATLDYYNKQIQGDPGAGTGARFTFTPDELPKQLPLARIYQYPLSKDLFDHWVAWHLTNTILFSPAEELDSVNINDVQKVYANLVDDLRNNKSIRDIIKRHQDTQENWRRFRSPEDNTREMIEIYLGLFDRDEDVPRASLACKEWYLTGKEQGYERVRSGEPNTDPQLVLDSYVTSCEEFYELIAQHPLLIDRVTTVLVEYFFSGRSNSDRSKLVASIVASEPVTFQDIFKGILFSREYLLNTERPKSFEENFLGTARRMAWSAPENLFQQMISSSWSKIYMKAMNWPAMSLKLGRLFGVPMDSLSFAHYHKGYREVLIMAMNRWKEGMGLVPMDDPGEEVTAEERALYKKNKERYSIVEKMPLGEYMDYLFLTGATRFPTDLEKEMLTGIGIDAYYLREIEGEIMVREGFHDNFGRLVFDYISRLPEAYYFKAIN